MEDDCVTPPIRVFTVKLQHQLLEEELHHSVIGVGLDEGVVDFPFCVDCREHRYPRLHGLLRQGIGGAGHLPLHVEEVAACQPGLIGIYDALSLLQ